VTPKFLWLVTTCVFRWFIGLAGLLVAPPARMIRYLPYHLKSGTPYHLSYRFGDNNYVRPPNTRMEMYAGHFACCPLMKHVEVGKEDGTDRRMNGQKNARPMHYAYCYRRGQRNYVTVVTLYVIIVKGSVSELLITDLTFRHFTPSPTTPSSPIEFAVSSLPQ